MDFANAAPPVPADIVASTAATVAFFIANSEA